MCWTPAHTRQKTKTNKPKNHNTICVGHHTYCVVFFVLLVFVFCLVYGGVQHILYCVFWFVCLRLLSSVWCRPTHIVFFVLFCLSSSFVLCMVLSNKRTKKHKTICVGHHHTQDKRRRLGKQNTQHNMCWTPPCTRPKTKTNKTNNTTQYVLDTTIHKTEDEDKQNKKHNTICVGQHHTQDKR
jgi:hypothetical protein